MRLRSAESERETSNRCEDILDTRKIEFGGLFRIQIDQLWRLARSGTFKFACLVDSWSKIDTPYHRTFRKSLSRSYLSSDLIVDSRRCILGLIDVDETHRTYAINCCCR